MNLSGGELTLLIAVGLIALGLAPYITLRRGGSKLRITLALLITLVPYAGWLVGMAIALTTRRPELPALSRGGSVAAVFPPIRTNRVGGVVPRVKGVAIAAALAIAAVLIAAGGYSLGRQDARPSPHSLLRSPQPTWVDREIRTTGTQNVGTLRCTYHLSDGSVVVRESLITIGGYQPFTQGRPPDCPPSP